MTMVSRLARTAVVGGGVLAVSTAYQLVRAGVDVVLMTENELASGASGRSLSWLNSAGERAEPYHRLRMAGIDRYRTLAAHHPVSDWLRFDGGLAWTTATDAWRMQEWHRNERSRGYESQLLDQDEVARRVRGVDPGAVPATGAVWNPGEGWVDLPSLVRFLIKDFLAHGGRLMTGAGRCRVSQVSGRADAVINAAGDQWKVDAVVLATGAAVPSMAAQLGVIIPDATTVSLLVGTRPLPHDLTAVLNTPRAALRPGPGGALSVDSDWVNEHIVTDGAGGYTVADDVVAALLAEASAVLAGHPRLEAAWTGIGPKPIPGDGDPVLGRVDAVSGLSLAFTHSGATLGLIAGELIASEIIDDAAHPLLAEFNQRRFG
jgi:glycine/D-amino acid oxidase-like deaminating enzyme